jgi:azurin
MNKSTFTFVALAALLNCAACDNKASGGGGGGGEAPQPTAAPTPAVTIPSPTPAVDAGPSTATGPKVEIQIGSVGNEMKYDQTALTVPAGAEVHLTLKNNGTLSTMSHNWVLVKTGTEAQVALDGLNKAPDAGFVVPGSDIYAHTPLAPPGQTVEVTFTAPAAGKYPYICTFPGHYVLMKGVLTVTP